MPTKDKIFGIQKGILLKGSPIFWGYFFRIGKHPSTRERSILWVLERRTSPQVAFGELNIILRN
jgi:hypothetical protein